MSDSNITTIKLDVKHQESYSKGQVFLRQLLGWLYIGVPHGALLLILGLVSFSINGIAFWAILFTGKFPRGLFNYQVKYMRYALRVMARFYHLTEGYPSFGLSKVDPNIYFTVEYPEGGKVKRADIFKKLFLGWLFGFIHTVLIIFKGGWVNRSLIWTFYRMAFKGNSNPESHAYHVSFLRYVFRVWASFTYLTEGFPPYNGAPSEDEELDWNNLTEEEIINLQTPGSEHNTSVLTEGNAIATQTSSTVQKAQENKSEKPKTKTVLVKQADGKIIKKQVPVIDTKSDGQSKTSEKPLMKTVMVKQADGKVVKKQVPVNESSPGVNTMSSITAEDKPKTKTVLVKQADGKIVKKQVPVDGGAKQEKTPIPTPEPQPTTQQKKEDNLYKTVAVKHKGGTALSQAPDKSEGGTRTVPITSKDSKGESGGAQVAGAIGVSSEDVHLSGKNEVFLQIRHLENYKKGQTWLRQIFGWLYIGVPHVVVLYFLGIVNSFCTGIAFWAILFTGKYPKGLFSFRVKYIRWWIRLSSRFFHLTEDYPAFGLSKTDPNINFSIGYPEEGKVKRGDLFKKLFFGGILGFIHSIVIIFKLVLVNISVVWTFYRMAFKGESKLAAHNYHLTFIRYVVRVWASLSFLTEGFPSFSGQPTDEEEQDFINMNSRVSDNGKIQSINSGDQTKELAATAAVAAQRESTITKAEPGMTKTVLVKQADGKIVKKQVPVNPEDKGDQGGAAAITPAAEPAPTGGGSSSGESRYKTVLVKQADGKIVKKKVLTETSNQPEPSRIAASTNTAAQEPPKTKTILEKEADGKVVKKQVSLDESGSASTVSGANAGADASTPTEESGATAQDPGTEKGSQKMKTILVKQPDGKIVKKQVPVDQPTTSKPPKSDSPTTSQPEVKDGQETSKTDSASAVPGKQKTKTILVKQPDGKVVKKVVPVDPKTEATGSSNGKTTGIQSAGIVNGAKQSAPPSGGAPQTVQQNQGSGNKGITILLVILTVLFLLMSGFIGFMYFDLDKKFTEKRDSWTNQEVKLNEKIAMLQSDYNALVIERDSLKDLLENPEKNEKLKSMISENNNLQTRISDLQKKLNSAYAGAGGGSSSGASNVALYKQQINDLKTKLESLEQDIQSMQDKNTNLSSENSELSNKLTTAKTDAVKYKKEAEDLQKRIEEASALEIEDLMVGGVKFKSVDKVKETDKASKLNKIQVVFSIITNKLANPGNRELYIVITDPNGKVLGRGNNTVVLDGKALEYTINKTQAYNNSEELVSMYFDKNNDDLPAGKYNVEVYIEEDNVGSSSFTLR